MGKSNNPSDNREDKRAATEAKNAHQSLILKQLKKLHRDDRRNRYAAPRADINVDASEKIAELKALPREKRLKKKDPSKKR